MGIISAIRDFFYQLVVRSHIVYYVIPHFSKIIVSTLKAEKQSNFSVVDESGKSIKVCKVNDRLYPAFTVERVETFSKITMRDDDVLLCGYPKTGCHWTFEILTMLVNGKAKLSRQGKSTDGMMDALPNIVLDSIPSPRVLNSHYYFEELPEKVRENKLKIIYTSRNPKDTVVSFFNHVNNLPLYDYGGEFNDYFKLFMSGQVEYGSYFDFTLAWDKHIKERPEQILLVHYEDLKREPVETVKTIAKFLGKDITDQFAEQIAEKSTFKKMQQKRSTQFAKNIFRKGEVGDWTNWLSEEQSEAIDKVWEERMTGCTYQPQYC